MGTRFAVDVHKFCRYGMQILQICQQSWVGVLRMLPSARAGTSRDSVALQVSDGLIVFLVTAAGLCDSCVEYNGGAIQRHGCLIACKCLPVRAQVHSTLEPLQPFDELVVFGFGGAGDAPRSAGVNREPRTWCPRDEPALPHHSGAE